MGFFSSIKDKIFGGDTEGTVEVAAEATAEEVVPVSTEGSESAETTPQDPVDVAAKLDALNEANAEDLNWRTSIVDLLKLIGEDSSFGARKELAAEVGIEGYEGTAENNIALNTAVLVRLSKEGGVVPAELLV